jgi:hypothetical protein
LAPIKHEVWINNQGLTTLCRGDKRRDECRRLAQEEDSKIIHAFYANSHFEAMTLYYQFMGWGEYTTTFESDELPYDKLDGATGLPNAG